MKQPLYLLLLCMCWLYSNPSAAQTTVDTTGTVSDTVKHTTSTAAVVQDSVTVNEKPKPFQPNPKKAGLYSSIVPGLGQVYNRQYWKVPVVYLGLGVAGYYIKRNLELYQSYRKAYISRINNPAYTDEYSKKYDITQLQQLQNEHSKYLNLTVLFTTIGYALQVIDAVTSAHLKNFDISRDISFHMSPALTPNGVGMGMVVNFK